MTLLRILYEAGLSVAERDGRLVVSPREKITTELRQLIQENREELLGEVLERELPPDWQGITPGQWAAFVETVEAWNSNLKPLKG